MIESVEPIDEAELERLRNLPWIVRLDAGDAAQLVAEYEAALRESYRTGDRGGLDRVLAFWQERAMAGEIGSRAKADELPPVS